MPVRRVPITLLALLAALPAAAGDKLDKEQKKFLEDVAAILLPAEEKVFKDLKSSDRAEFVKIFWARRDPDPQTPANEFQQEFEKAKAEADKRFSVGRPGATTDCGATFIVLGEPAEVSRDPGGSGPRAPETWTYRGKGFGGGEAKLWFDAECMAPRTPRLREQLAARAAANIANPNFDYRFDKNGRLLKLDDLKPKPSPAQTLIENPRSDFPLAGQPAFLRNEAGGTVLAGLLSGDAAGLTTTDSGGTKAAKLVICARAVGEDAKVAGTMEHETAAPIGPDGHWTASFGLVLRPGRYTVTAGVLDPKTQKGSAVALPVEVPDLNRGELSVTSLVLVDGDEEAPTYDPNHAFGAFHLGNRRLIPHPGNTFAASQPVHFFFQYYDPQPDATTGQRSSSFALSLKKDGQKVAEGGEGPLDGAIVGKAFGPVVLKWGPGKYLVHLTVRDNVAGKDLAQEVAFEVK